MLHQAVAKIKQRLKNGLNVNSLGTLHPRVRTAFDNATTPEGFLDLLIALDKVVSDRVGAELVHYNIDVTLGGQEDRSAAIRGYGATLFDIYCIAAPLARHQRFIAVGGQNMQTVANNVVMMPDDEDSREAKQILRTTDGLIMLSLLCGLRCAEGKRMVRLLASKQHRIGIEIQGKRDRSSLLAYTDGGEPFCTGPKNARGGRLFDRVRRISPPKRGGGGASRIRVPYFISLEDDKDFSEIDRTDWFHPDYKTMEGFYAELLHGSLSFDSSRRPFYSPPRLEFTHELIHVLHNALGTNRLYWNNQLTLQNQQAWTNAEEYWTIAGGHITENAFNHATELPARFGHSGLSLDQLEHGSAYDDLTLRRIAKNDL